MVTGLRETQEPAGKRMGGVRADFVASLGRRVAAARESLRAAVATPDGAPRQDLLRRLHALSTHAELLHFAALAAGLARVRGLLTESAPEAPLPAAVAAAVAGILDEAPQLAWGESSPTPLAPPTLPFGVDSGTPAPAHAQAAEGPDLAFLGPAPAAEPHVAPPEDDALPGDARVARARVPSADVDLAGVRVLVADDDAGAAWYFADRFRSAGCVVEEAGDGRAALTRAFATHPEVLLVDILMPGMDGLTFARLLRRDVALRDAAIFHTSWREDWLARARELTPAFTAGLRKDTKTDVLFARTREALRPRARIAARLAEGGVVRGRLDGLTAFTLLRLLARHRPDARVQLRDAAFLYAIDLVGGAPRRATRTDSAGRTTAGARVLAAALGACAGRFEVLPRRSGEAELEGSLDEQLAGPLAQARNAALACSGPSLLRVERVRLDEEEVSAYVRSTPLFLAEVVARLAAGVAPRSLMLEGGVAPAIVEDLLLDLAARGALRGVVEREELSIPITVGTPVPSELAFLAGARG